MKAHGKIVRILFFLSVTLALPGVLWADELRLSVAASMTGVISEVGEAFVKEHPQVRLVPNFASSGSLAKQLVAGAPADIYISANPKWMDYLVARGAVPADAVVTLAHNHLVLVGHDAVSVKGLQDLPGLSRIALCSPQSSPAGRYAQQALEKSGLYDRILKEGKLVLAKDVRQALLYADRGEVDAAFVYATDALLASQAKILFEVPQELYPRVTYPMGLTTTGADREIAREFVSFLHSGPAKEIFRRHGFVTVE
ncbi:MAG: molybdate ABC transporter substrate-binding protein [Syntrophotaleaceae bacterium]